MNWLLVLTVDGSYGGLVDGINYLVTGLLGRVSVKLLCKDKEGSELVS